MMDKQSLLEFIERNYADDDLFAGLCFWTKSDVEDNEERELDEEQFERFDYWMSKYADSSFDYNEAVAYALRGDED